MRTELDVGVYVDLLRPGGYGSADSHRKEQSERAESKVHGKILLWER
jgi:hypothetical protein